MTLMSRFFDRLSRNDKMRNLHREGKMTNAQIAHKVYRDIYYL